MKKFHEILIAISIAATFTQLAQAADETLALANSLGALGTELGKLSSALSGKLASTLTAGQTGIIGFYEQKAADAKKAKAEADAKKDADEAKHQQGIMDFYAKKAKDEADAKASTLTAGQKGVIGFYEQKAKDEADAKKAKDEAKQQQGIMDFYAKKAKDEADAKAKVKPQVIAGIELPTLSPSAAEKAAAALLLAVKPVEKTQLIYNVTDKIPTIFSQARIGKAKTFPLTVINQPGYLLALVVMAEQQISTDTIRQNLIGKEPYTPQNAIEFLLKKLNASGIKEDNLYYQRLDAIRKLWTSNATSDDFDSVAKTAID